MTATDFHDPRPCGPDARAACAGFSLVEALVALALLSILALLAIGIWIRCDRAGVLVRERLSAWQLLVSRMET